MSTASRIVRGCAPWVIFAWASLTVGFDCGGSGGGGTTASKGATWMNAKGTAKVIVTGDPFSLSIQDANGLPLLESSPIVADSAYAPVALTHNTDLSKPVIMYGWDHFQGEDGPWKHGTHVESVNTNGDTLTVSLATNDDKHAHTTITVESQGIGVHLVVRVEPVAGESEDDAVNRASLSFVMHDDDHFFGFGERFVYADQRGHALSNWVEDGAFGHGEGTPISQSNPSPNGPAQTNIPIPWMISTRGFGMLQNTTFRPNYHLGDERPEAWRVEATTSTFDATIFVDPEPRALVAALTEVTGRPPPIADWLLAPRRRGNAGSDEMAKLRAAHIPTSVIDTAIHYFPAGVGDKAGAPMRAITADIHARGFKAIAYFCPFVSKDWHPVFDDAVAHGYLVKKQDGSPYTVLDTPYYAGMVDFTNPEAVKWYQGFLQGALDDGWDGWMYDFAEYIPQDAVFANGMTGFEGHNLYPVLYQKAANELLEKQKSGDYLIFVRSGYTGTGGQVTMVWGGDQSADFDIADGLPAALAGALNAGLSGIPLWGSDISGYHYVFNPPPDKEVYLRWTEVGAFSADMHDENEGAGNSPSTDRWQIWKDQETQDIYRKYASYKTRMLPYVRVAVNEARAQGTPVMRHLLFSHPKDARVYGITDEYMYGDSLLVAPVVTRGLTSRSVYLPDDVYFDFWTGARVAGHTDVMATAPLDVVPLYAKMGAIIPLLAADVETVVPASDGSVVSMQDRASFLEVRVFPGGDSNITLDDGTVISASAPTSAFDVALPSDAQGAFTMASSEPQLTICDRCAFIDASTRTLELIMSPNEKVTAGALTLSVNGGNGNVKRYFFVVRY